jgi:hypothetical protein
VEGEIAMWHGGHGCSGEDSSWENRKGTLGTSTGRWKRKRNLEENQLNGLTRSQKNTVQV